MKKIFTLLFCVTVMSLAANATDYEVMVQQCINKLLSNNQPTAIMASNIDANLDVNHDGVINIADVTTLIDMSLIEKQQQLAPAQQISIETIINDMLDNEPPTPTIDDVTNAVDHNIKLKK